MADKKKYIAQWRYRSNMGAFDKGQEVTLTDEEAEMFNRDSPGVLKLATTKKEVKSRPAKASHTREK